MDVQERYGAIVVGANTTVPLNCNAISGFLPWTSGTLTVVNCQGVTIIGAIPVTEGIYVPMPFFLGSGYANAGASVTTADGASGTLGVW